MKPNELVAGWRNKAKAIHNNPDDYSIGVKAGIEACADGLELEIKRSNFVSLNLVEESILENELWSQFPYDNVRGIAKYLLQYYHIVKK